MFKFLSFFSSILGFVFLLSQNAYSQSCLTDFDICQKKCYDKVGWVSGKGYANPKTGPGIWGACDQVCIKKYFDKKYNSDGTLNCVKSEEPKVSRPTYIPPPKPTYTPPEPSSKDYGSAYKPPSEPSSPDYGSAYKPPSEKESEQDIRKKLGTDLETLKTVSALGGRNARTCVGSHADKEGWLHIKNTCSKSVNFGYCYDNWVPDPNKASNSNPFTCDTTGKLAWGGADNVRGGEDWQAPLQAGSKSRKLIFGACMSEVILNDRKYVYLHSKRTSAAFRGGVGQYKCIYTKSAGQE